MPLSDKFTTELNLILDDDIRNFARHGLDVAPAYLATIPASISGRHHPPDERAEGGRVLHMKRVARLVFEMGDQFGWKNGFRDCMVAAALLHDIVCMGVSHTPTERMQKDHDVLAFQYLENHGAKPLLSAGERFLIYEAMEGHMGRFASQERLIPKPGSPGFYLHMADYMASLPWVTVEPLPEMDCALLSQRAKGVSPQ